MKPFLMVLTLLFITSNSWADDKTIGYIDSLLGNWKGEIEIQCDFFHANISARQTPLIIEPITVSISNDSAFLILTRSSFNSEVKFKRDPKLSFTAALFGFPANFLGVRRGQKIKGAVRIPDLDASGVWEVKKQSP